MLLNRIKVKSLNSQVGVATYMYKIFADDVHNHDRPSLRLLWIRHLTRLGRTLLDPFRHDYTVLEPI